MKTDRAVVRTVSGPVSGERQGGVWAFRGVPYAVSPTGRRRFRPPEPPEPWTEVRECTRRAPACPQEPSVFDAVLGPASDRYDEDCLVLNVWTPAADDSRRPVMVWIHGGSWEAGSGAETTYDGGAFAEGGTVLVTINYRLHALGFLYLPGVFADAEDCGNLGLRDAVAALTWVRESIAAFGGDPANITIFGESAGGGMVGSLLAMPSARGLFRRAILMSGSSHVALDPESASVIAGRVLKRIGVAPGDWDALQAVPVDRIVRAAGGEARGDLLDGLGDETQLPWNAVVDARSMPTTGYEAVRAGACAGVDVMAGWTADEYRLRWLVEEPNLEAEPVARIPPALFERLVDGYATLLPGVSRRDLHEVIENDRSFMMPAVRLAEAQLSFNPATYVYHFAWASPVLGGRIGSCHALELPFVFKNFVTPGFHGDDPPADLADAMSSAWAAFARGGDPNGGGLPPWPRYDLAERLVMRFDGSRSVVDDLNGAARRLWDGVPDACLGVR